MTIFRVKWKDTADGLHWYEAFFRPADRLTITMGKFFCTANSTSTGCISEKKNSFLYIFHSEYFAQRFHHSVDKYGQTKNLTDFCPPPQVIFLQNFWAFRLKCAPCINDQFLQVSRLCQEKFAITETDAYLGQNWPKSAMRVMRFFARRCWSTEFSVLDWNWNFMRSGVGDSQIIKMEIKDDFFNEGGGVSSSTYVIWKMIF